MFFSLSHLKEVTNEKWDLCVYIYTWSVQRPTLVGPTQLIRDLCSWVLCSTGCSLDDICSVRSNEIVCTKTHCNTHLQHTLQHILRKPLCYQYKSNNNKSKMYRRIQAECGRCEESQFWYEDSWLTYCVWCKFAAGYNPSLCFWYTSNLYFYNLSLCFLFAHTIQISILYNPSLDTIQVSLSGTLQVSIICTIQVSICTIQVSLSCLHMQSKPVFFTIQVSIQSKSFFLVQSKCLLFVQSKSLFVQYNSLFFVCTCNPNLYFL